MRLSVEDHAVEIKRTRRRKQQIEIFEGLCEQKALHRVGLLFRDDALERGVADVAPAMLYEVTPHCFSYLQILWIPRVLIQIISRFNNLWTQRISGRFDLHFLIVEFLRLDSLKPPHPER